IGIADVESGRVILRLELKNFAISLDGGRKVSFGKSRFTFFHGLVRGVLRVVHFAVRREHLKQIFHQVAVLAQLFRLQQQLPRTDAVFGSRSIVHDGRVAYQPGSESKQHVSIFGIGGSEFLKQRQRLKLLVLIEQLNGFLPLGGVIVLGTGLWQRCCTKQADKQCDDKCFRAHWTLRDGEEIRNSAGGRTKYSTGSCDGSSNER